VFRPSYALFLPASNGVTFQPNPNSGANPEHLEYFRLVGIVIGKAISDGQLLDAHFTRPIYKHMLGMAVSYHDLEAIEPEYYKSLCLLLSSPLVDLGFEDSLSFSADSQVYGISVVVDLLEDGRHITVTDANKAEYVRLIAHHRMTAACRPQLSAFLEGFHALIPLEAISFFDPLELELLISGLPDIDIEDLKNNTDYSGYRASDPTIIMLWTVVRAFSKEEKALFVQFFSGTSKVRHALMLPHVLVRIQFLFCLYLYLYSYLTLPILSDTATYAYTSSPTVLYPASSYSVLAAHILILPSLDS
jgi:E3 ubiquitin-protein ligase HUWE1